MWYVYDLVDSDGQTVYVGESKNPKIRFKDHTRKCDGKFLGREDLTFKIISSHRSRKKALQVEGQRKLSLGFMWTETDSSFRIAGGNATAAMKKTCPNCGKVSTPGAIGQHMKACT